jgi:K+-transporting ATPase ATPase C chain
VTFFSNRGPNAAAARFFYRDELRSYLALNRPHDPGLTPAKVPVDAVTTSASGVDPQISKANAAI